jgi:hypothetical protein
MLNACPESSERPIYGEIYSDVNKKNLPFDLSVRINHGAFGVTTKHENGLELGVKWEATASEPRSSYSGAEEPEYEYDLDAERHNEM